MSRRSGPARREQQRREPRPRRLEARYQAALGLVILGSIAILPFALNRFVFIKLAVVAAGAAVAMTIPPRGRLAPLAMALGGLAATVLLVAALIGDQPLVQVIGRGPRYEGIVALAVYAAAAFAGARLLGPRREPEADRLLSRLLSAAALAVAALAVLEALGLRPLSSTSFRPGSLLGNASDQGAWSLLVLGPLVMVALRRRDPWAMAGAAAASIALVTSASRGALVGAVAIAAVILLLGRRAERLAVLGGLGVLAVVALAVPLSRQRLLGQSPLSQATVPGREQLWAESIDVVSSRPWLGTGPSGFVEAIISSHTPTWYQTVGPDFPPDSPHSWPLQVAAAGGLALLAVVLVLGAVLTRHAWVKGRGDGPAAALDTGLAAGLAGYAVALMFHFTSPGATLLAAAWAGGLLAVAPRPAGPRAVAGRGAAALLGVLSAVLLLAALAEIPLKTAIADLQRGDLAAGDSAFDVAQRLRPWDVEVCATAGHAFAVLASRGSAAAADVADPWLVCAARRLPQSVWVMEDQASIAEARGDLTAARSHMTAALARDPYNPNLHLRLGIIEATGRNYDAAEQAFLAAAEYAPTSREPWENLEILYRLLGQQEASEEARQKADRQSQSQTEESVVSSQR